MTPELKIACELVFQQHKSSPEAINWNRTQLEKRISLGLRELAKETLVRRNVIFYPNPAKRSFTVLNPAAGSAENFEEAEHFVRNNVPVLVKTQPVKERPLIVSPKPVRQYVFRPAKASPALVRLNPKPQASVQGIKWYLRPAFFYIVWPACAAALSILIAYFLTSSSL